MEEDDIEAKSRKLFKDTHNLLKNETNNLYSKLISLGYEYCYEEGEDIDVIEEQKSKPKNANQRKLILYFAGEAEPNEDILNKFLIEKHRANPNYPLFRKYFRQGNLKLKELLLFGLDINPTSLDLLLDLGFFNEFNQILDVVIKRYIKACRLETNKDNFIELVNMFYFDTSPYGYDSFMALQQLYNKGDIKKEWLDSLKKSIENDLIISLAKKANAIH
jgi:hypothetical protein